MVVREWPLRRLRALTDRGLDRFEKRRDDERRWLLMSLAMTVTEDHQSAFDGLMASLPSHDDSNQVENVGQLGKVARTVVVGPEKKKPATRAGKIPFAGVNGG